MIKIGLTGGIGSGKSTVCQSFSDLGAPVIDADIVAREVVQPGKPALQELIAVFGPSILDENGHLNRVHLRKIVFACPTQLAQLNAILHPLIYENIEQQISSLNSAYCLVAVPLLLETHAAKRFDRILVIDSDPRLQIERVMMRNQMSVEEVGAIMRQQLSGPERLKQADDIITNNGTISELAVEVKKLHNLYTNLANSTPIKV